MKSIEHKSKGNKVKYKTKYCQVQIELNETNKQETPRFNVLEDTTGVGLVGIGMGMGRTVVIHCSIQNTRKLCNC